MASLASGNEAASLRANEEDTNHKVQAFSPDGRWLAFGAADFVEIYDTQTRELLGTLPTGPPLGLCFQKSGEGLLVSGDGGLFRWPIQAASGPEGTNSIGPPQRVGSPGAWQQAGISENGEIFAAFHGDHIETFEAENLRELAHTAVCGDPDQFRYVTLSADGHWLATGGWHDAVVNVWNSHTGKLVKELSQPDWLPDGSPYPVFGADGHSLITLVGGNYRIWETNSWTTGPIITASSAWLIMAISHRGGMMATRSEGSAIQLRDISSGALLATLQAPNPSSVTEIAFSPDDTQLAVVHNITRELIVWDLRLLRKELAEMGLDWDRPAYPARAEITPPRAIHLRVLTNTVASFLGLGAQPVK